MPLRRRHRFDASDVVTMLHLGGLHWQPPEGPVRFIRSGERLAGDDPAVQANPGSFAKARAAGRPARGRSHTIK